MKDVMKGQGNPNSNGEGNTNKISGGIFYIMYYALVINPEVRDIM